VRRYATNIDIGFERAFCILRSVVRRDRRVMQIAVVAAFRAFQTRETIPDGSDSRQRSELQNTF
jgi:hypothetical protein